jgi:steroid delta-isomerase-like uncharacterized protein
MVSWDTLEVDGRQVPTLNAGLTAARPDQKGNGASIRLYRHVVSEAQERERLQQCKLIVWGTLGSPIAYRIAREVFADLEPLPDGTYSEGAGQIARAVRRKLGFARTPGAHPFVFPRLVAGVRFTEAERRRLADVCRAKSFSLFDRLGVDEARGDRLLFVAAVPARDQPVRSPGPPRRRSRRAGVSSCDPQRRERPMSNPNAERSRRWFEEIWNRRRLSAIEEFLTPESVGHTEAGDLRGVDEFKRFQADVLSAFPDLFITIEAIVADGDDVVIRWRASGCHSGDGLGVGATQQQVSFEGMTWHRYRDGMLMEGWNFWNHAAMVQRLRDAGRRPG